MIVFHYRRHVLLPICRQHVLRFCFFLLFYLPAATHHEDAFSTYARHVRSHAAPDMSRVHRRHLLPRNSLIPLETVRLGRLCHYRRLNGVITSLGVCLRCAGQACVVHGEPKTGRRGRAGKNMNGRGWAERAGGGRTSLGGISQS